MSINYDYSLLIKSENEIKSFFKNNENLSFFDIDSSHYKRQFFGNFILRYLNKPLACSVKLVVDTYDDTGNIFIETKDVSNNDIGWFLNCKSDLLFYYFSNSKDLYIIPRKELQVWFDENKNKFKYVPSYKPSRDTAYGALVPRKELEAEIDLLKFNISKFI